MKQPLQELPKKMEKATDIGKARRESEVLDGILRRAAPVCAPIAAAV